MKTVLGLDLGVASIGWAIVKEDKNKQELIRTGVRVIPIDSTIASDFEKGNPVSKNKDRTLKRQARRNNHRYKLRKNFLTEFLAKNNLWPLPEGLFKLDSVELYGLRDKALTQKVTLPELARIWYHLNQKRGYIDSRKGISEDETDTKYVEAIKTRSSGLYTDYKTVGSYFYHKLLETKEKYGNANYRVKSGDDKENIFLVDDYKLEFDEIWKEQKKYYPNILNDSNNKEIRDKIIFFKRKLKSQKHLIGECRFEKYHKCMPISSPIHEEIRLWQDVNKLRITNKFNEIFELTLEQKQDLFNYLWNTEKISEKDLLKRFGYPTSREGYKFNYDKFIRGYVFRVRLKDAFEVASFDFSAYESFDSLSPDFNSHILFSLWHVLYSIDEIKDVKKVLSEKYSFPDNLIESLLKLPIKNDFSAVSSRAARKILPFLREGKLYNEACEAAGYNHSDSITKEENNERVLTPIKELALIKPNQLRNPTVEKILNQLINLLKGLDEDGYQFDEVRIELARELKKSAKERKKITELNRDNKKKNEEAYKEIQKHGFNKVSKKMIEKYLLWTEFDGCSPYECGKRIELGDLFNKALYEIEHIIPRSRYFDDSFTNKTICRTNLNKEKDNQTAFDYMKGKSPELHIQYVEAIKHNNKISKTKRRYLQMSVNEIPDDFINRQLNETRYITKETLSLLKKIYRNVHSTSGTVTDYLKHHWGYNDTLMQLNFDRVAPEDIIVEELEGGKKRRKIKDWTKRLDHRHHALDAIVVACTKQSYIQQLNALNKFVQNPQEFKQYEIRSNVPFTFETVKSSLATILVSYKAGKKVATIKKVGLDRWGKKPGNFGQVTLVPRGALHEESIYGSNKTYKVIPVSKLKTVEQCAVAWQKELIEQHLAVHKNDLKLLQKNLKKSPIIIKDEETLDSVTIFETEHVKRYNLEYTATNKFDEKAAASIVNKNVRDIVLKRLKDNENDPAKAFKDLKNIPVYFNKEKGIVIKTVRCYTGGNDYPALHTSTDGVTQNHKQSTNVTEKSPVDFVKGGNNHHIAFYADQEGNRYEECVTFFEAFEKKRMKQPVIQKEHPLGYKYVTSIQVNEMFVFGLSSEELDSAISEENTTLISKHLYRVQKLQSKDYWFRHHLETKLDDTINSNFKKYLRIRNPTNLDGIKVSVSKTGSIKVKND